MLQQDGQTNAVKSARYKYVRQVAAEIQANTNALIVHARGLVTITCSFRTFSIMLPYLLSF